MKEKLALIVVFLMIVSLSVAGCTKTKTTTTEPATEPDQAACAIHREGTIPR